MLAKTRSRPDSDEVQRDAGEREKETAAAAGRKIGEGLGFGGAVGVLYGLGAGGERGPAAEDAVPRRCLSARRG